jgi:DNA-binding MarR family transcriptional regulator
MVMNERPGFELVFLLGSAFRQIIDRLHVELAEKGHPDARPIHGFALQAIGSGGITTAELGRRLGVSKQAAAKTVKNLETLGYVARVADTADARSVLLMRTALGGELLEQSARFFDESQQQLIEQFGEKNYAKLLDQLGYIAGDGGIGDLPGWLDAHRFGPGQP